MCENLTPSTLQEKVTMEGGNLLWTFPKSLSPLVRAPFRDRGLRVGVEGRLVSDCTARQRGYIIRKQGGNIKIWIPFGAEGGYIKVLSRNVDGHRHLSPIPNPSFCM